MDLHGSPWNKPRTPHAVATALCGFVFSAVHPNTDGPWRACSLLQAGTTTAAAAAAAGNENPRVASVARRSLARQVTATDERESGRER